MIYATASPVGGSGLAEVTGQAVTGIWEAGALLRAVTPANRQAAVPRGAFREVRFQPTRLLSFLPSRHYYPMKRAWVDHVAARCVTEMPAELVHGWTHEALRTLRAARRAGAVAVLERNYAHPRHSRAVLEAEYAAAGIPWPERPWPGLHGWDHWARELTTAVTELAEADLVLVPAAFTRETLVAHGVEAARVRVLPRGVDAARFRPAEPTPGVFRVLYMGQVCLRKGVRYLLEAWRRLNLPGAELTLAGSVHDEVRPLLAAHRDLPGLRLLGHVADPAPLYAAASAFVLPTLDEGSAKVTAEAMAAALPVITTPEAGSPVEDGRTGFLVPARDAEALAERLALLHASPGTGRELGAAARAAILPWTWARYRAGLLEVYREAVAMPREPQAVTDGPCASPEPTQAQGA